MNETLGKIHFWVTVISFNAVFLPMFAMGMAGHQRRIFDPTFFDYLQKHQNLHVIATVGLVIMLAGQIPFLVNLVWSFKRGHRAERNPWLANTLEWVAPSPPGHGNFEAIPEVHRGPYEYSLPNAEKDWLGQWEAPPLKVRGGGGEL